MGGGKGADGGIGAKGGSGGHGGIGGRGGKGGRNGRGGSAGYGEQEVRNFTARMHFKEQLDCCVYVFVPGCCPSSDSNPHPLKYSGCEEHIDYSFEGKGIEQVCAGQH